MAFEYSESTYPIRDDIAEAHRWVWDKIARPGSWWSGAERVAIAREMRQARRCSFCAERKAALSPAQLKGQHDSEGDLPGALVDAIHRVTTDAPRLTRAYIDELNQADISDAAYVEMLGIVVALVSIDVLHEALDLELEALPEPVEGKTSHYLPDNLVDNGAYVKMLAADNLPNQESSLFGGSSQAPNVLRAMSAYPDSVRMLTTLSSAHYIPMTHVPNPRLEGGRAISRAQIELVAGRVSAMNDCFY
jgi:alkylhydroperoxidase family enzyme